MSDIPVIFSAPMVRALLEGRKTMTRRLAWRSSHLGSIDGFASEELEDFELRGWSVRQSGKMTYAYKPSPWQKIKPGDRLWVREAWGESIGRTARFKKGVILYRADHGYAVAGQEADLMRWRPSIYMRRTDSRLTLIVTATKIEPLQNISEKDAEAEGAEIWPLNASENPNFNDSYRVDFRKVWENIHGQESWDANSEVVALTFIVHQQNIDQVGMAA